MSEEKEIGFIRIHEGDPFGAGLVVRGESDDQIIHVASDSKPGKYKLVRVEE